VRSESRGALDWLFPGPCDPASKLRECGAARTFRLMEIRGSVTHGE